MKKQFPIIGIGASAGGLEPLEIFFEQVAPDTSFAYVIIQHLAPNHKSLMDELLARHTQLPISVIQNGMMLEKGHIYLNPPKKFVEIKHGKFVLYEKEDRKLSFPISIFFQSLANELEENACAVILSGTGSDGKDGVKFIKEKGGYVVVQEPEEAKFNGMPNSAINAGSVDKICRVKDINGEIHNFFNNKQEFDKNQYTYETAKELITKILKRTQQLIEVDFTGYKHTTVSRRIGRRMNLLNYTRMEDYYQFLDNNPGEANFLSKELLIGVTRFFRDEESFEVLKHKVIPELVAQNMETKTIRIWVTACSTGEEAFSIAILLKDYLRKNKLLFDVSIFATDFDKEAIKTASNRVFSEVISHEIPIEYFNSYFVPQRHGYVIAKEIREMIVFSCHNLIQDAPFNRIDLVSCRNLLIYLNESVQQQLFSLFQYSLKTGGFLFLGSSETLGTAYEEFEEVDKKYKIYSNRENKKFVHRPKLRLQRNKMNKVSSLPIINYPISHGKSKILSEIHHNLIQEYVPDSLVMDEQFNLLHTTGNIHRWLRLPPGEITSNALKMIPNNLAMPIEVVVSKVFNDKEPITLTDIVIPKDLQPFYGNEEVLQIHIRTKKIDNNQNYLFLTFEAKKKKQNKTPFKEINISSASSERIEILERELRINRETLQTTIEELESSNEELQAANEELQSSNEELESVNEELYTVNSEFQQKNTELSASNDDLNNLIQSAEIAILFLDAQLNIRRFTPAIKKILDLISYDIGRNISHFRAKIQLENFMEHIEEVLKTFLPYETSVKDAKGKEYLLKINPFRTNQNEIKGVVLIFIDLTQVNAYKKEIQLSDTALADLKLKHANQTEILELISQNLNDMVLIIDRKGSIEYCTPSASALTGYTYEELLGMNFFSSIKDTNQLDDILQAVKELAKNKKSGLIEFQLKLKKGINHWFETNLQPINNYSDGNFRILLTASDIQKRSLRETEYKRNSLIAEQTNSVVIITDTEGRIIFVNKSFEQLTGYFEEEVLGIKPGKLLQGEESDAKVIKIMSEAFKNQRSFDINIMNYTKKGDKYLTNIRAEPLYDSKDKFIGFFSIQTDISKQQEYLTQIQTLNTKIQTQMNKLKEANSALEEFAYVASHDLKTPVRNIKSLLDIVKKKGEKLDKKKKEEYLDIVHSSAEELYKMIENLLQYSRTGAIQEELEKVVLQDIIQKVIKQFNQDLKVEEGTISIDILPQKITVYPMLFSRLLANLISNAIKYRGDAPPRIKLSCRIEKSAFLFSLTDNGIGIPENQSKNIFKIFKSIRPNKDSNGIGLALCKKITELHGGKIWLTSKLGKGSTFYFTIPMHYKH
ncbi:PAS domain S-box protein [Polaribacter litorisediminis]|uniref:CheR family methyltransferase n=1 Tax=Polaribacter litorisediminis TaxID=1908341 RepID=UPI001CBAA552|nr:CheR family methyltransferase [Polaribacter litorisediminis]UAM97525.1 PAS domain S-box protein [Polaribacter litorisediminis]